MGSRLQSKRKKENLEHLWVFQLWQDLRLHFRCTFPDLAISLEYECISTPSVSLLQVKMAIKAAAGVISCQHKQGVPFLSWVCYKVLRKLNRRHQSTCLMPFHCIECALSYTLLWHACRASLWFMHRICLLSILHRICFQYCIEYAPVSCIENARIFCIENALFHTCIENAPHLHRTCIHSHCLVHLHLVSH